MTVTVDVISGEKSVFDYLMKPILKSRLKGNVVGHHRANATAQDAVATNVIGVVTTSSPAPTPAP